jgi:predicted nuclease of predicted toxin-antitoxin system
VKFLVDNQLPTALARWLAGHGHDAVHVLDRAQAHADDRQLWADADAEERIVVSKDEDFFILATRPADVGRLLWLRVGNCRTPALLSALDRSWPEIERAFQSGQRVVELR